MAKSTNAVWIVIAVLAVGGIAVLMSVSKKQEAPKSVVMEDVFKQVPPTQVPAAVSDAAQAPAEAIKDPVPSPAIVTSPQNGKEEGFSVQVYSFQDRVRAEKALDHLKEAGYKAYMEVSDLGEKGTWYRVRIGELNSEADAKAMLEEVRKNYKSGFIVKPKV